MVANAVDDASAFEVDREIAVVPAADGGLADRGVFFVGQAETLQHGALAIASRRQCKGAVTLLADGDFDSLSASAQREEEAGQQQAGARHASVSGGGRGTFTGLASLLGLFLQDVPCQQLALGYQSPDKIDITEWQDREDEGILYVPKAGEMLYRVRAGGPGR